jgi:S-adenosylmethionine/arginine decarboxylase-like enzyme
MSFTDDQNVLDEYNTLSPWGMITSVDLYDCDPELIRDPDAVRDFVVKLCNLLGVKRFGETVVVDFGEDPRVSGLSMTQLIETSLVSGHFANQTNAAYIDIFSCKYYPPFKAVEFTKEFFKAKSTKLNITFRQ